MLRSVFPWLVVGFGLTLPAGAQPSGGPPPFASPEVAADRTLTLRYFAPDAKQVTASGELDGTPHPMSKGSDGVWTVTLGPMPPDIYTYSFNVDGVVALDPKNANTKYGYSVWGAVSVVEVPGDGPQFYDVRPVPHGQVRIQPYVSKTLGLSRTVWVYTPPGYERGRNFPVLYLLHGAGDIESGWTMVGRANNILDNLIAEGKAKPMVVVMPLGHAVQSFWTGPSKAVPDPAQKAFASGSLEKILTAMMAGDGNGGLSPFAKDLVEDVMPMVAQTFKVSPKREDRAIAGLSMGGGQSINLALARPDLFCYVALMSPAATGTVDTIYPQFFKDPATSSKQFKLFWLGVGKDDTLTGPGDQALHETLVQRGIEHTWKLSDGRHEWTVWRHHLQEVAPLLFR